MAELREAAEWFESAQLRHSHLRLDLWLGEGHLLQGDRVSALPLIEAVLRASRETGYVYFEGLACWLMGECLAAEAPTAAAECVEIAIRILERVDARNDLAKAMVTRAALRQRDGDAVTAASYSREPTRFSVPSALAVNPPRSKGPSARLTAGRKSVCSQVNSDLLAPPKLGQIDEC